MERKTRKNADFEAVCEALLQAEDCHAVSDFFAELCSSRKTSRIEMENMLYEYFGMSAEELTRRLYG